jgi:hypothetical protein
VWPIDEEDEVGSVWPSTRRMRAARQWTGDEDEVSST